MRVTFLLLAILTVCLADESWKIVDVDRTIDLTTQIVKTSALTTFENVGSGDQNSLLFVLPVNESEHLAYIMVREEGQKAKLKHTKQNVEKGFQLYKIDLTKPVAKGASIKLRFDFRLTDYMTPYPAAINQGSPQFVKTALSTHFTAAYPVAKEKTTFKIQDRFIGFSGQKEAGKAVFGPYTNQPAFNTKFMDLHYENNFPIVVATVVERKIEISHWGGNIAVEEYIELENKGAKLKGTFSRLDHTADRRGKNNRPYLQQFTTILPASAKDIYYRDEIGNISTSAVRVRSDSIEVTITPRFPLFGGWRTSYVLGYNLPSYEYLHHKGESHSLKMMVLDHIFDNIVIEKLITKVTLPENAKNPKILPPFTMERRPNEYKSSYLDTSGRTTLVVQKENLVEDHMQQFTVTYDYDWIQMLKEPLIASLFYLSFFVVVIIYVRLDFSLSSDHAAKAAEKLSDFVRRFDDLVARKSKIYSNFIDEVTKFKDSRDESVIINAKKALEDSRHAVNNAISEIINRMKTEFVDVAEKASELLKYDKVLFESVDGYITATVKSKQKSSPEDNKFAEKALEAKRRVERIIDSLHQ